MSKRFSFEIKIIGILLLILTLVVITGIYAYQQFSGIVNQISDTRRPDTKLITAKALENNINDAEISVKSYRITTDTIYLGSFYRAVERIDKELTNLHLAFGDSDSTIQNTQLQDLDSLINAKVHVLDNLLVLQDGFRTQKALDKVVQEIEDNVVPITNEIIIDSSEKKKKRRIFNLLSRNKDKVVTLDTLARDTLIAFGAINTEVRAIKREELAFERQFKEKELEYILQDQVLTDEIKAVLDSLESNELSKITSETKQAETAIAKTNQQVALFLIVMGLLLVFMSVVIINYIRNNNKYRKALRKSKEEAEDLAKMKQKILANISHEIRTPMNSIAGFSEQIGEGPLTDEQRTQLDMVKKSTDHLLYLINDVLDLSKLQADKINLEKIGFNPTHLIQDIAKVMQQQAALKNIETKTAIDPNLPDVLIGDPFRLQQILFNIIGNAVKFTHKGQIQLIANAIKIANNEYSLIIRIIDDGVGIDPENIDKIFNEFEQAEPSTTRNFGGTGLGLSIVKSLIELHQGEIKVASELGKGTNVTIKIPYKIGSAAALPQKEPKGNVLALKYMRILIVDDEKFNRLLIISILKKQNVHFAEATNGEEAIIELDKNDYDLVLMDMQMPVLNGLDATKRIRKENKIPILAITAAVSEKDIESYRANGINDFLAKPIKTVDLLNKINTVMGEHVASPNRKQDQTVNSRIDLTSLKNMSGDDRAFYLDMLRTFKIGTQDGVAEIQRCLSNKDWPNIAELAHKISSPCSHIGAQNLYLLLKETENICRKNENLNELEKIVSNIKEESDLVIKEVTQEIEKIS